MLASCWKPFFCSIFTQFSFIKQKKKDKQISLLTHLSLDPVHKWANPSIHRLRHSWARQTCHPWRHTTQDPAYIFLAHKRITAITIADAATCRACANHGTLVDVTAILSQACVMINNREWRLLQFVSSLVWSTAYWSPPWKLKKIWKILNSKGL